MHCEGATKAVSHDRDRFLKVTLNMRSPEYALPGQAHYGDQQYTIKGDGFFVFLLPYSIRMDGLIRTLTFTFWKIDLKELLIALYFA